VFLLLVMQGANLKIFSGVLWKRYGLNTAEFSYKAKNVSCFFFIYLLTHKYILNLCGKGRITVICNIWK
jgi:hypothetical protein